MKVQFRADETAEWSEPIETHRHRVFPPGTPDKEREEWQISYAADGWLDRHYDTAWGGSWPAPGQPTKPFFALIDGHRAITMVAHAEYVLNGFSAEITP